MTQELGLNATERRPRLAYLEGLGGQAWPSRRGHTERNTVNLSPPWVDVTIAAGETVKIANIVDTLFHLEAFGALRVTCTEAKLTVTSRVYSMGAGLSDAGSLGQDFAGVPASFAIGRNETTVVLGGYQTVPAAGSEFRFNIGLVEVTGASATVRWTARDPNGVELAHYDRGVAALSQVQGAFKDYFPGTSVANSRITAEVIAGSGKVIAYGSMIANDSQDPTTFEMTYPERVLADGSASAITGITAGPGLTGGGTSGTLSLAVGSGEGISVLADTVAIADGGVTTDKLSAAGSTAGQVLTSDGTSVSRQDPAGGGASGLAAVAHNSTLQGSGTAGAPLGLADYSVTTAKLSGNAVTVQKLADDAVGSAKIIDGSVGPQDLSTGSVRQPHLAAATPTAGQVLSYNGTNLQWVDAAGSEASGGKTRLLFPFVFSAQESYETAIHIMNTGLDPFGTAGSSGTVTFYDYGTSAISPETSASVAPGESFSFVVGKGDGVSISPAPGFGGYVIAVCNFPFAHGFFAGFDSTYSTAASGLAIVLPATRDASSVEMRGH